MTRKPSHTPGPQQCTQVDKFRDLARDLEADEDEKAFEDQVRRIAKTPPAPPKAD